MFHDRYVLTISRLTVDKLGVKLYDRVSAVIAEMIANGYDADATEVTVEAPMDTMLASLSAGQVTDLGFTIRVSDNGCGMAPDVINSSYLKVGGERRKNPRRGDCTPRFHGRVMGRKGVGKLAPFGICNTIEVTSSGGDEVDGVDEHGNAARGYRTAHFFLKRSAIMEDEEKNYEPDLGPLDGTVRPATGLTFVLPSSVVGTCQT